MSQLRKGNTSHRKGGSKYTFHPPRITAWQGCVSLPHSGCTPPLPTLPLGLVHSLPNSLGYSLLNAEEWSTKLSQMSMSLALSKVPSVPGAGLKELAMRALGDCLLGVTLKTGGALVFSTSLRPPGWLSRNFPLQPSGFRSGPENRTLIVWLRGNVLPKSGASMGNLRTFKAELASVGEFLKAPID